MKAKSFYTVNLIFYSTLNGRLKRYYFKRRSIMRRVTRIYYSDLAKIGDSNYTYIIVTTSQFYHYEYRKTTAMRVICRGNARSVLFRRRRLSAPVELESGRANGRRVCGRRIVSPTVRGNSFAKRAHSCAPKPKRFRKKLGRLLVAVVVTPLSEYLGATLPRSPLSGNVIRTRVRVVTALRGKRSSRTGVEKHTGDEKSLWFVSRKKRSCEEKRKRRESSRLAHAADTPRSRRV